jgi:hypothetical protein
MDDEGEGNCTICDQELDEDDCIICSDCGERFCQNHGEIECIIVNEDYQCKLHYEDSELTKCCVCEEEGLPYSTGHITKDEALECQKCGRNSLCQEHAGIISHHSTKDDDFSYECELCGKYGFKLQETRKLFGSLNVIANGRMGLSPFVFYTENPLPWLLCVNGRTYPSRKIFYENGFRFDNQTKCYAKSYKDWDNLFTSFKHVMDILARNDRSNRHLR